MVGTFGVTMVMAQQYLPGNIGMASGLSIGFAIGLGGVAAVFLGAVADSIDLRTALFISAAAPVVAARADDVAPGDRGAPPARAGGGRPVADRLGRQPTRSEPSVRRASSSSSFRPASTPAKTAGMNNSYVFDIEGAGTWTVKVADGGVTVDEGDTGGDCTISTSAETFEKVVKGEQNPTAAYMSGKLKIKGDMGAAMKLQKLF